MTDAQAASSGRNHDGRDSARIETILSYLLRAGVIVSMLTIMTGLAILAAHHPDYVSSAGSSPALIGPKAEFPHSVSEVLHEFRQISGRAIIVAGLMVLIITPILRVAVSVIAFAIQRDWPYVTLTLLVLLLLLGSLTLGLGETG